MQNIVGPTLVAKATKEIRARRGNPVAYRIVELLSYIIRRT